MSKTKPFFSIFWSFFESVLNFEHFQKNIPLIAYVFLKLPTTKDLLKEMSKLSRLRGPLDRQHGKRAETLIQS